MKAMILAAGLGTRMRPLTDKTPKPLLEVGGLTLIEHHLLRLKAAGFGEVIINISYLGQQIETKLGSGDKFGLKIVYSREDEPLESGGGVLNALPLLGKEPFLLVNGDIWCDFNFKNFTLPDGKLARVLLVRNPGHNLQGDFCLDLSEQISGYDDVFKVYSSGDDRYTYTFSGISVIDPEVFENQKPGKFSFVPILRELMDQNRVCGQLYEGGWVDVGTPKRLKNLDEKLKFPKRQS